MADEERPFMAEYAKSGRAGCKQCSGVISKDSLRLARMVQSSHFDGKIPNWYHFGCFYKVGLIKNTNEVSGYGSLRWEDQERIRKRMPGEAGGEDTTDGPIASSKKEGKGGGKRKSTRSDLKVEYAKSNRSACKGCFSQIDKDEIRIAKMVQPEADKAKFGGLIPSWHHVDCFLENLESLDASGVTAEELSGFTKLKKETKDELKTKFIPQVKQAKKGKKRKAEKEEGSPPPVKVVKEENAEEKALKEQSTLIWKYRDQLKEALSKSDMERMMTRNKQKLSKGEAAILDQLADGMVFGALQPCPTCQGQLVLRSHCYECTGNISGWSKCLYSTDEPEKAKWVIPEHLKEIPFCKKYKFKSRRRVFRKDTALPQSMDVTDGPGPSQSDSGPSQCASVQGSTVYTPLQGFRVFIIGRHSQPKPVLVQQIEAMGGKVVTKIDVDVTICLATPGDLSKLGKKMLEVEACDVPVVSESFLKDAAGGGALLKIPSATISDWGAPRHSLPAEDFSLGDKSFKSKGPSKVKMLVKGSSVVDPDSDLGDSHHVLEEKKRVWNAVLGLVDIVRGTNSYYKLQLLEGDKMNSYFLFRSWGRVGTTIGGNKVENFGSSKEEAKRSFMSLFMDKTGNDWEDKSATKKPGKFYPLEIDYGQSDDSVSKLGAGAGSSSELRPEIQSLIRMIFDVESMKRAMVEFEIDMKKMPLGKLSRRQMETAYSVLSELQKEISGRKDPSKILDGSNRFYTLIPHDFGIKKPPLLDSDEVIKLKTLMVDNLLEIELAYSLLKKGEVGEAKDPLDVHYEQLKTDMEVLSKSSDEFQRIVEYVKNTHAATHNHYDLEVEEVFKLDRQGEIDRFQPFSSLNNRQLLWHGSGVTNFCGILSQGLRIAPPEAPVTGYMFGKGIYFADMVSKSANYCRTSRASSTGLMLLCEVALGDMYELTSSEYVVKLPPGKNSTKGVGRTAPDPSKTYTTDDGVAIPLGEGKELLDSYSALLYNEYPY